MPFFSEFWWLGDNPATDDPDKDLEHLKKKYEAAVKKKVTREKEWHTNFSFFHGRQLVMWSWQKNKIIDFPTNYRSNIRVSVNVLWSRVMTKWARQSKLMPIAEVSPRTTSSTDKEAARKAQRVLDHLREELELDKKKLDVDFLQQLMGSVFVKVCPTWDRNNYLVIPKLDENGNEVLDENGDAIWIKMPKTKIECEVVNAFNILTDDTTYSDEKQIPWIADVRMRDIDYVRERYGVEVSERKDKRHAKVYESDIRKTNDQASYYTSGDSADDKGKVPVIEFYEAPSARWVHGRILTFTDDTLLQAEECPSDRWWNPFVKLDQVKDPLRFWASTWFTHCISLQNRYNLQVTRIDEYIKKMSKGKIMAPKGAGLADGAFDTSMGEIIEYNPIAGNVPQPLPLLPIPQHMIWMLQNLLTELDNIAGLSQPNTRGKMPANVRTATQAALIQESDDIRDNPVLITQKLGWEKVYSRLLEVFEEFQEDAIEVPLLDKVTGERTIEPISGKMINGNTRVVVQLGNGLPQSRIVRNQQIQQWWASGLLGNPQDDQTRKFALQMMEFADVGALFQKANAQEQLINEENSLLLKGQLPKAKWWHDHTGHNNGHLNLLISKGMAISPLIERLVELHLKDHDQLFKSLIMQTKQQFGGPPMQTPGQKPPGGNTPPQQPPGQPKAVGTVGQTAIPRVA